MEDWRSVTRKQVIDHGGGGLLYSRYEGSLAKALSTVYPTPNHTTPPTPHHTIPRHTTHITPHHTIPQYPHTPHCHTSPHNTRYCWAIVRYPAEGWPSQRRHYSKWGDLAVQRNLFDEIGAKLGITSTHALSLMMAIQFTPDSLILKRLMSGME